MHSTPYQTILVEEKNSIVEITLNRPNIHNAFDDKMILELTQALDSISNTARVLIMTGNGESFCAGADMNWMKKMKEYSFTENLQDAKLLAEMLEKLYRLPIPTIAKVNGLAIGGGVGLVAASDIAIAIDSAIFALSEVRLGLVPACISPYLLRKIPSGRLAPYFLTGMKFNSTQAKEIGLVHEVVSQNDLNQLVQKTASYFLSSGKQALKMAKELLAEVPTMSSPKYIPYTSEMIAKLRSSEEGQEGLSAFLEKRKPKWIN